MAIPAAYIEIPAQNLVAANPLREDFTPRKFVGAISLFFLFHPAMVHFNPATVLRNPATYAIRRGWGESTDGIRRKVLRRYLKLDFSQKLF